jgi:hypothetical protein
MADEKAEDDTAPVAQQPQQPAPAAAAADEAKPNQTLFDLELAEITSAELKPVNAAYVDLISPDPDKTKARKKAESDYADAMKPNGELKKLYEVAENKFLELAKDIEKSPRGDALLDSWCKNQLARGKPVYDLIARQCALTERFKKQASRYRFADVIYQKAKSERIGKNYADWLTPISAIKGRIESYLADIDKINAALDAGEKPDWPIYQFWFVVAPKHSQLRAKAVDQGNTPGFDLINGALTGDISSKAKILLAGPDRNDGSIYVLAPDDYLAKRQANLQRWREASEAYARAVAENKFRPDEPAKLQQRIKDLADSEAATVKALLGV